MEKPIPPYAPPVWLRLLIWLGIYFWVQLFFASIPHVLWLFPLGLIQFFSPTGFVEKMNPWMIDVSIFLAYSFYVAHLALSLLVRHQIMFWLLIGLLLVALALNFFGMMSALGGL